MKYKQQEEWKQQQGKSKKSNNISYSYFLNISTNTGDR